MWGKGHGKGATQINIQLFTVKSPHRRDRIIWIKKSSQMANVSVSLGG